MNTTTAILAGLLALGSASAFAEGGAERMRHYYDNFPVHHAQSEQKADTKAPETARSGRPDGAGDRVLSRLIYRWTYRLRSGLEDDSWAPFAGAFFYARDLSAVRSSMPPNQRFGPAQFSKISCSEPRFTAQKNSSSCGGFTDVSLSIACT
jgi:hypothetical protein